MLLTVRQVDPAMRIAVHGGESRAVFGSDRHALLGRAGCVIPRVKLCVEQVTHRVRAQIHGATIEIREGILVRRAIDGGPEVDEAEPTSLGLVCLQAKPPLEDLAKLRLVVGAIV